jgi:iron complex outermembrane recepter protein
MKHNYILYIFLLIAICHFPMSGQKIIEGYVFDVEKNTPLSGVLIYAKNTVRTVISDPSGNFRIIIPEKADILVFSYSGYSKKEVNIKGNARVEIGLRSFSSNETESVVVIGSRDQTRTKGETYVAVDIIPVKDVMNESGYIELSQILHFFAPSFNANKQSGADLADHIDPVSLRGLGPDQVLYLINGKQYINSSIINVFGTKGRGNVSTDLNAIPASAIERIEVLRDGAAAQYGSDAIAGVVNIVLKKSKEGTFGALNYGENITGWGKSLNYENKGKIISKTVDGSKTNASLTHSFDIYKGSMTVSANYFSKDFTQRAAKDSIFSDNYRQGFGDAKRASQSIYFSAEYPIKKGNIYMFGGIQLRKTNAYNWSVSPEDSLRNVYEIYSNGYNPQLLTHVVNSNTSTGYKSKIKNWNTDISMSYGNNAVSIDAENTLNPSLLQKSPTSFYLGSYKFDQFSINLDINKKFPNILNGLNLAFGSEYKKSHYNILNGEENSWRNYMPVPLIRTNTNGKKDTIIKNGTAQGFPGISTTDALTSERTNLGFYGDAEIKITPKLGVASAFRFENYSDFGSAFGGKLAARYNFNKKLSVRISTQTGYRAPSLAQLNFRSTINDVDEKGTQFEKIIANSNSTVARQLGIPQLKAETSLNAGVGLKFNPNEQLSLSADGYYIQVNNRIVLTSPVGQDNELIGKYLKYINIRTAQFYINALNTETQGLDIAASFKTNIGKGKINMSLLGNFNKMTIPSIHTDERLKGKLKEIISYRELQIITAAAPPHKFHYNFNYQYNKSSINLNLAYFSKVEIAPNTFVPNGNFIFKPRLTTDISFSYKLHKNYTFTIGADNIFDVYPTIQEPYTTDTGGPWESVQQGYNGAFFFARFAFNF